jgi:hypothetical protein
MSFRRIIRGKSKLPAYYTAEKHDFPQDNPWKVKILLYKGFSQLLQIILAKKSTMGDQYYPRFKRKN